MAAARTAACRFPRVGSRTSACGPIAGAWAGYSLAAARATAGYRRILAAPLANRSGYWATVAAMTATSATKSAHPHSGTTMPPRRFAVKSDMTMTTNATAGAP
jgi:hypothetical protein